MESVHSRELKGLEAAYRVRLSNVIFPIEFRELREALAKNGYELAGLPGPVPPRPARISFSGGIARKGEHIVEIDSDLGTVGVIGKSIETTLEAFGELSRVIIDELGVKLDENARYYEVVAHYNLDTGKNPVRQIEKIIENNFHFKRFGEILGEPTSSFGVRLIPRGKIPNQEEWFDISIEPDILKAHVYHIGVVFRSPDEKKIISLIKNLGKMLIDLVEVIEGAT